MPLESADSPKAVHGEMVVGVTLRKAKNESPRRLTTEWSTATGHRVYKHPQGAWLYACSLRISVTQVSGTVKSRREVRNLYFHSTYAQVLYTPTVFVPCLSMYVHVYHTA